MASAEFEQAVEAVKGLSTDPGNDVKLRLYGAVQAGHGR